MEQVKEIEMSTNQNIVVKLASLPRFFSESLASLMANLMAGPVKCSNGNSSGPFQFGVSFFALPSFCYGSFFHKLARE